MTDQHDSAQEEFAARIADKALKRMGWDTGEDDDDSRLIRSAVPTVVDETLQEVLDVMHAAAEEATRDDPR